jgi:hypothetical protein
VIPSRRNHAIDRSKLAHKAKPLGELIIEAMHKKMDGVDNPLAGTIPPVPTVKRPRRRRAKAEREAPVVHDCLKWLHDRGIFAWRQNSGTAWIGGQPVTFGYPGAGDITGILPDGRRLEIECKSPTGTQSPKQKEFEAKVVASRGVYILVRSVEDLERWLR